MKDIILRTGIIIVQLMKMNKLLTLLLLASTSYAGPRTNGHVDVVHFLHTPFSITLPTGFARTLTLIQIDNSSARPQIIDVLSVDQAWSYTNAAGSSLPFAAGALPPEIKEEGRNTRLTTNSLLHTSVTQDKAGNSQDSATTVARMYQEYKRHFPEVADITPEAVMNATNRTAWVLVDVRDRKEQAVSILPGAITRQQFERDPNQYTGRKIVTYCTIGYRSGLYAKKLQAQGWEVYNLTGSILGWVHAGGHVEHEGVITKRVHVYGEKWDFLPEGYESVK